MSDGAAQRLMGKMRLMVSRMVLGLANDSPGLQAVQVQGYADLVRDQAERMQNYGFTSVPLPGAEGIGLAVGGSTNHTVIIVMDDRRYRLTNLRPGEVALYDDLGQCVHLTRDGIVIKGAGLPVTITDTPEITLDADVVVSGSLRVDGPNATHGATNIGQTHVHGGVQAGFGSTGTPE